jgi:hypothetical protein
MGIMLLFYMWNRKTVTKREMLIKKEAHYERNHH